MKNNRTASHPYYRNTRLAAAFKAAEEAMMFENRTPKSELPVKVGSTVKVSDTKVTLFNRMGKVVSVDGSMAVVAIFNIWPTLGNTEYTFNISQLNVLW